MRPFHLHNGREQNGFRQRKARMTDAYLDAQFLIAMPTIGDPRFERTLIYMCAHTDEGAMGIVVNKPIEDMMLGDLLHRLGLLPPEETNSIHLPQELYRQPVFTGGPVEPGRGFVLHSMDYHLEDGTLDVDGRVGLTASLDILHDLVRGRGPRQLLLALGYAGWAPGQLEAELMQNAWLTCPADTEILFDLAPEERYAAALRKIGIDPGSLSAATGHA